MSAPLEIHFERVRFRRDVRCFLGGLAVIALAMFLFDTIFHG